MAGNTLSLPVSGDEEPWPSFGDTSPDLGEMTRRYTARAVRAVGDLVLGGEMTRTEDGVALGLARVATRYVLTSN